MIESFFAWKSVQRKQREAPLLKERERYLLALLNQGVSKMRARSTASLLIHIVRFMEMDQLREVNRAEIRDAGKRWLTDRESHTTRRPGKTSLYAFVNAAEHWFRFHNVLAAPSVQPRPFDSDLTSFIQYMRIDRQFTPSSIEHYKSMVSLFLRWAGDRRESISDITLFDIEEFLQANRNAGWKPGSLAGQCQALRTFFHYCELQGWSDFTITRGIRSPRVQRCDKAPRGPRWGEVRRLAAVQPNSTPSDLRARAIILLCSIYATRGIEIANLNLNDFDWINETFTLRRAKHGRVQQFPIQYEVGQAILDYLKQGRPTCSCRQLFTTLKRPYRALNPGCLWEIVGLRMRKLGIESENMGTHSLRHACATQLLRKGSSLKDIADFLGHRDMKSVSIYAKCDVGALQSVAAFTLAGVR
jgi:integrase/recombinase XerD